MKAVLISINPAWCDFIFRLAKKWEFRKNKPKLPTPFKCYIYCTKEKPIKFWKGPRYSYFDDRSHNAFDREMNGTIIGEFICNEIKTVTASSFVVEKDAWDALEDSCLSIAHAKSYADWKPGTLICNCKPLYKWHISNLVVYDEPKELSEFGLSRAPQSWCYVEEAS